MKYVFICVDSVLRANRYWYDFTHEVCEEFHVDVGSSFRSHGTNCIIDKSIMVSIGRATPENFCGVRYDVIYTYLSYPYTLEEALVLSSLVKDKGVLMNKEKELMEYLRRNRGEMGDSAPEPGLYKGEHEIIKPESK